MNELQKRMMALAAIDGKRVPVEDARASAQRYLDEVFPPPLVEDSTQAFLQNLMRRALSRAHAVQIIGPHEDNIDLSRSVRTATLESRDYKATLRRHCEHHGVVWLNMPLNDDPDHLDAREDMLAILREFGWCETILEVPEKKNDGQEVRAWCNERFGPQWWPTPEEMEATGGKPVLTTEALDRAAWMIVNKDNRSFDRYYAFKDPNHAFEFRMRWT